LYAPIAFVTSAFRFSFWRISCVPFASVPRSAVAVVRGRLRGAEIVRRVGGDLPVVVGLRVIVRDVFERRVGVVDRGRRRLFSRLDDLVRLLEEIVIWGRYRAPG